MTKRSLLGFGLREISSKDNPDFRWLLAVNERPETRRAEGLCWLEGPRLIEQFLHAMGQTKAVSAGASEWACEALVFSEGWLQGQGSQTTWQPLMHSLSQALPEALVLPNRLFSRLAETHAPPGIGLLVRSQAPSDGVNRSIEGLANIGDGLVLDGLQDPGNLGSLLRTAAAAGLGWAAITQGSADPWSPKCLRAGMGAQFVLRLLSQQEPEHLAEGLLPKGVDIFAADPLLGQSIYTETLSERLRKPAAVAWVFGQEGRGLSDFWKLEERINKVFIPQSHQIESLNVGAAAAICLFERRRCLTGS